MLLIDPNAALKCAKWIKTRPAKFAYDKGMLLCFRVFRSALADLSNAKGKHAKRLRVYFMQEGFARLHLGPFERSHDNSVMAKNYACLPTTDVIAHGWKNIGKYLWLPYLRKCPMYRAWEKDTFCLNSCPSQPSKNEFCHWLQPDEEFIIARDACFWRSPSCSPIQDQPREITPVNRCYLSSRCQIEILNLERWKLCSFHGICNPVLPLKAIEFLLSNLRQQTTSQLKL